MLKIFDDYEINKLPKGRLEILRGIWTLLETLRIEPEKQAKIHRDVWKKHGMDIPMDDSWKNPISEGRFKWAVRQVGSNIGDLTDSRKGFLTPIQSKELMDENNRRYNGKGRGKEYDLNREHFVEVSKLAILVVKMHCNNEIKNMRHLWEIIYQHSGVVLTTSKENQALKNRCKDKWKYELGENINKIDELITWQKEFNHYGQCRIELLYPPDLLLLQRSGMTYHVDLVTDDMITYCEKTPKDLKQEYEKVETVQGEKSKKKIPVNPLSSRFF